MGLEEERERIVTVLRDAHEPLTAEEIARNVGETRELVLSQLGVLRRWGIVVTRRGRRWTIPQRSTDVNGRVGRRR